MSKRKPKQCKIGSGGLTARAAKDWKNRQRRVRGAAADAVANLPAPPAQGTSTYACMDTWLAAYVDAVNVNNQQAYLGSMVTVLRQLQNKVSKPTDAIAYIQSQIVAQQELIRQLEIALAAQTAAYMDCIQGTLV